MKVGSGTEHGHMLAINGLVLVEDYIGRDQHDALVAAIDVAPWRTDLSRRTQHYGYVYDYRARRVDASMYLGQLPVWLADLAIRVS
jgi:hypothetical protein